MVSTCQPNQAERTSIYFKCEVNGGRGESWQVKDNALILLNFSYSRVVDSLNKNKSQVWIPKFKKKWTNQIKIDSHS